MHQNNIQCSTVNKDFCSGCGICSNACPNKAISIVYDKTKQYKPIVNEKKCIDCGLCVKYCP